MILFPLVYILHSNPSMYLPFHTESIFKWSTAGLNSELSFWTGCLTKAKEPILPNYLPISNGRTKGLMYFSQFIKRSETKIVRPLFEFVHQCHFLRINSFI